MEAKTSFTEQQFKYLQERGIDDAKMKEYHSILVNGYPFIQLTASCQLGRDIKKLDEAQKGYFSDLYRSKNRKVLKFVPASGAASRMFKDLFAALESGHTSQKIDGFFENLDAYAFASELLAAANLQQSTSFTKEDKMGLLKALLSEDGLNYGAMPKGLIKFHKYSERDKRTAFEEHFHEGAAYAGHSGDVHIHFTVPVETKEEVENHLAGLKKKLEPQLAVKFTITTSVQKESTDTPAIYEDTKEWVELEGGELLFRPAGHGALLENLNQLDADIIFVKNIDNIVPDRMKPATVEYKESLAGCLIEAQEGIFGFLGQMDSGILNRRSCDDFIKRWFGFDSASFDQHQLREFLNRPLRACGMVKNEGEPGGGPFTVSEATGKPSLQIVEMAQVNLEDQKQKDILQSASHFNPVDLILGTKDYKGQPFDLLKFRKMETGMVVNKTFQGRDIRALELPGLWNGSMHHWNTIFVEVPIETFNPVKTVFDLTREAHRG